MNECIDSTMGRIPRMLAVLLASDDPRTSWSFQSPRLIIELLVTVSRKVTTDGRSQIESVLSAHTIEKG